MTAGGGAKKIISFDKNKFRINQRILTNKYFITQGTMAFGKSIVRIALIQGCLCWHRYEEWRLDLKLEKKLQLKDNQFIGFGW